MIVPNSQENRAMNRNELLIGNIDRLHTTPMGADRVKRNQRSLPCVQTQALALLHAHTREMEEIYGGQRKE